MQLAKGAIRSGMEVALREFGVSAEGLDALWLAGAFGNYLHPEAALACGLVPVVQASRLQPVGNAAAQGCKLALLSRSARGRAEALARIAEPVELATHAEFAASFFRGAELSGARVRGRVRAPGRPRSPRKSPGDRRRKAFPAACPALPLHKPRRIWHNLTRTLRPPI